MTSSSYHFECKMQCLPLVSLNAFGFSVCVEKGEV